MKTIQFDFYRYGNKSSETVDNDSITQIAGALRMMCMGLKEDIAALNTLEKRNGFKYVCDVSEVEFDNGKTRLVPIIEFECFYCDDNSNWYVNINYSKFSVPVCCTDSINELKRLLSNEIIYVVCSIFAKITK